MTRKTIEVAEKILCPACNNNISTQKEILAYKPVYMKGCDRHLELWMAADRADRAKVRKIK